MKFGDALIDLRHVQLRQFCSSLPMASKCENTRWDRSIADLERRIAEQTERLMSEAGVTLGSVEVLGFMVETLKTWRDHSQAEK